MEGEDGVVRWRDVTCEDVDDFDALWSEEWAAVEGKEKAEGERNQRRSHTVEEHEKNSSDPGRGERNNGEPVWEEEGKR